MSKIEGQIFVLEVRKLIGLMTFYEISRIGIRHRSQKCAKLLSFAQNGAPRATPAFGGVPYQTPLRGEHPAPEDPFTHG